MKPFSLYEVNANNGSVKKVDVNNNYLPNLEYRGGFNLVGFEAITVFYDRSRGIVRVSRGNHRDLMKLLTDGEYATIPGKLIPHDATASDDEMLLIEAVSDFMMIFIALQDKKNIM